MINPIFIYTNQQGLFGERILLDRNAFTKQQSIFDEPTLLVRNVRAQKFENSRILEEHSGWGEASLPSRVVQKIAETTFQLRREAIGLEEFISDHAAQRDASPHLETTFTPAS